MTPPHPHISPGKDNRPLEGSDKEIYDAIGKIAKPIFDKAAQEASKNHTLVGQTSSTSSFNPHNYRLYFSYQNSNLGVGGGLVRGWFAYQGSKNHNSEHLFQDTRNGTTIRIKKTQAEVRFRSNEWKQISNLNPEEIDAIVLKLKKDAITTFKWFVHEFGGKADFKPLKEYYLDNALKDNSLTEKQRLKDKYETPVVKKLYNEKKLEYKTLTAAKNAAHNAGLYDFSPEIAGRLDVLDQSFTTLTAFTEQINLHLAVQDKQLKNQEEMNRLLKNLNRKVSGEPLRFLSGPSRPASSEQLSLSQFYGG